MVDMMNDKKTQFNCEYPPLYKMLSKINNFDKREIYLTYLKKKFSLSEISLTFYSTIKINVYFILQSAYPQLKNIKIRNSKK